MRYTGEVCPYCMVEFTEQDDVVVCPDCGTPHHRVCWFAHGECASADKHVEGYLWRKSAETSQQPDETKTEEHTHTRNQTSLDIICPDCGENCGNGTLRCPNCGAVLIPFANPMGEPPLAQFKPGFNSDEEIRGIKSGDIALFCRTAGASYIKKFRKKTSWNWAAFFFSPYWFFYRKLHKAGAFFFAVYISLNLIMVPVSQYVMNMTEPFLAEFEQYVAGENSEAEQDLTNLLMQNPSALEEFALKNQSRFKNEVVKPICIMYAVIFLMLVLKVVAALTANKLYFKKACTDIKSIRRATNDERTVQLELFRRGGTNILWGSGSYLVGEILIYVASGFMTQ